MFQKFLTLPENIHYNLKLIRFHPDLNLGTSGGIYFYYNGSATGKAGQITIIPKRIDLSIFFIEDAIDEEIFTWVPEKTKKLEGDRTLINNETLNESSPDPDVPADFLVDVPAEEIRNSSPPENPLKNDESPKNESSSNNPTAQKITESIEGRGGGGGVSSVESNRDRLFVNCRGHVFETVNYFLTVITNFLKLWIIS
jgi:hypothetical protein